MRNIQFFCSSYHSAWSSRVDGTPIGAAGKIAFKIGRKIQLFLGVRILTTKKNRSQRVFTQKPSMTTARKGLNNKASQINRIFRTQQFKNRVSFKKDELLPSEAIIKEPNRFTTANRSDRLQRSRIS